MNILKDLRLVYKNAIKKTLGNIKTNPIVLLLPLFYGVVLLIKIPISRYGANLGLLWGFISPLIDALILSSYFSMLSDTINYNRINIRYIKSSFTSYFVNVYTVFFIFMLINFLVGSIGSSLIISLVLFITLNSIGESLYLKNEQYVGAFETTLKFTMENIIHWNLPLMLYLIIGYLVFNFNFVLGIVSSSVLDFPFVAANMFLINIGGTEFIKSIVFLLITGFYVLFRGHLYNILSGSTIRKREYMGEIDEF